MIVFLIVFENASLANAKAGSFQLIHTWETFVFFKYFYLSYYIQQPFSPLCVQSTLPNFFFTLVW